MNITIVCVGKSGRTKHDAARALVKAYSERLPWPVTIKEVEDKRPGNVEQRKGREAALLLKAFPKNAAVIALDERGKSLTSREFARTITDWGNTGIANLCFVIGGADGLDDSILQNAHLSLSLSAMTWPHLLARVMLLEQLYRAWSLQTGHPYHRD